MSSSICQKHFDSKSHSPQFPCSHACKSAWKLFVLKATDIWRGFFMAMPLSPPLLLLLSASFSLSAASSLAAPRLRSPKFFSPGNLGCSSALSSVLRGDFKVLHRNSSFYINTSKLLQQTETLVHQQNRFWWACAPRAQVPLTQTGYFYVTFMHLYITSFLLSIIFLPVNSSSSFRKIFRNGHSPPLSLFTLEYVKITLLFSYRNYSAEFFMSFCSVEFSTHQSKATNSCQSNFDSLLFHTFLWLLCWLIFRVRGEQVDSVPFSLNLCVLWQWADH